MIIRTRFAPSPTGKPHVGNIRTAIFNYLHAKSKGGEFILRIEDTDRERFVPESVEYIEESMEWLGLTPDNEEKIHQSDRLDVYAKYAEKLLTEGRAYKCFCSKERLVKLREEQTKKKMPPGYDAHCRKLTKEDIEELEKEGGVFVLRFRIPESPKEVAWDDLVRGKLAIRTDIQEDFIIMKSDGYPTYNFANIIDDHEMKITDVVRGEEFIPSTPKHILLYQALGWEPPKFAHLSIIIGPDKKKLAKRHGDTAIMDYKAQGYLADSMLNFLALLGWNDGTIQEIFTRKELVEKFDLKRAGKAPAVFDMEKLNWIQGEKIRAMSILGLTEEVKTLAPKFIEGKDAKLVERALTAMQTRMVTLKDFTENSSFFFEDVKYPSELLVFKKSTREDSLKGLEGVLRALENTKDISSADNALDLLKSAVESENLSNGDVFWPVRVTLSGLEKSPSPNELMWALGYDESLKRIKKAVSLLKEQ